MTTEEPVTKRRRLDGDLFQDATQHTKDPLFPPIDVQPVVDIFENIDPFLSPGTASSWPFNELTHNLNYSASQEALRLLMFDTVRSVVPTRANTPVDGDDPTSTVKLKHILATGKRIQYLKNCLSHVAPWVSLL